MPPPPPREAADQSAAVFAGEVASADTAATSDGVRLVRVTFRVLGAFKGVDKEAVVYTSDNSAACGFPFEVGEQYLVYAGEADGRLHTGLCTRTKSLAQADEDLEALDLRIGEGRKPSCGGSTNAGMLQAALFTLMGLALAGRRAPH